MSVPAALATPLSEDRLAALARVTDGLDAHALWWLSGYAAGLASRGAVPAAVAPTGAAEPMPGARLTVVYGSQTGNAKRVAERLAAQGEAAGLAVRLLRADAYPLRELKDERALCLVISTQGDGDPPDDARGFVEFLSGKRAPELKQLRYAVLGLGDSSYPQFCAAGRKLDERLAELGATRLLARADADLDIDSVAAPWLEQALAKAKEALKPAAPLATVTPLRPLPAAPAHGREAPFAAELLLNQRITGRGSAKDIRHIELSLEGSGLHYEPGDALGVWPANPPALVQAVLEALRLDGGAMVEHGGEALPLRQWLGEKRELTRLARPFVARHAAHARSDELNRLLAPDRQADLARLLGEAQVLDLLLRHPAAWSAEELVAALRPLTPRLYSIASSRKHVGDEAHLTVAHLEYVNAHGRRWGAASHLLAASAEGARLRVYVEPNERFRLPADGGRDVIMIGPGTGVAPFRGFVQERAAVGARGRNWLLFGNPHFRTDFLYQVEWQQALKDGRLHRLDLAFSRDQAHKVYVQDRLRDRGRELFDWLEDGAHLYVCGDAARMAKDVHAALREIVAAHGGKSAEDAEGYLNALQQQGRYARDVY
ncbi:assimilatory sulfite reductase (NADPH) flavoprotein subunit [Vulcaniibacterium tengchongense]|uniref:Sulfite reductase [NADPH] flavoprotein alpha-component n=1 Tax=Vulcaniibacterium tengchongense TaxID=1273429 RepID=A0A3N4V7A8_9GAMM|nr:assimilatory sulfite reductase (NADPH) flavoprotein subunit [Vulcaniibacterium tengchongense]RPE77265.1 sulfite reductase (NADPH) alpha subunit [Vulcaniibacterium tengchongense]